MVYLLWKHTSQDPLVCLRYYIMWETRSAKSGCNPMSLRKHEHFCQVHPVYIPSTGRCQYVYLCHHILAQRTLQEPMSSHQFLTHHRSQLIQMAFLPGKLFRLWEIPSLEMTNYLALSPMPDTFFCLTINGVTYSYYLFVRHHGWVHKDTTHHKICMVSHTARVSRLRTTCAYLRQETRPSTKQQT